MLLTGMIASSATAPRQSGLKKPRPPRSTDSDQALNGNNNSNTESYYDMAEMEYSSRPKIDLKDEVGGFFPLHCSGYGRDRYDCSTPQAEATQTFNMGQESSFSVASHCCGSTKATLITGKGDELSVTGKNFKTVLLAYRILLKELDANLVKIETVPSNDNCNKLTSDIRRSQYAAPVISNYQTSDERTECQTTRPLSQQTGWNPNLKYTKRELLSMSMSALSRQPPSLWTMITSIYSDYCLPAREVREYFDPTNFRYHDGTLVVPFERDQCCTNENGSLVPA